MNISFKYLVSNYSENLAGIISLAGSTLLLFGGSVTSIIAAVIFTIAELCLARFGNKTIGYSAGALLFAIGDVVLALSPYIKKDSLLFYTLLAMAAAWMLGAIKYPVEYLAGRMANNSLIKLAGNLPVWCGSINLLLRIPGIVSAVIGANYIIALAITAWAIADILAGRLQERLVQLFSK